jgi:NAD(P)-dependent dehydrogenase (short-subunit alcohol dehydrogenase family)
MLLENRVVFLTGGAGGIGRECALAYVREGASVVIADVDADQAHQTAADLGAATVAVHCDLVDGPSVQHAVAAALARFGRIDAVHNHAGIAAPSKPLDATSETEWDQLFSVNLKSVLWTTCAALPALKLSRGTILNTASLVGLLGQSNHACYAATKGAMITLTKCMALDYAAFGIRVNAVCPAGVWTPMLKQWAAEQPNPAGVHDYLDEFIRSATARMRRLWQTPPYFCYLNGRAS